MLPSGRGRERVIVFRLVTFRVLFLMNFSRFGRSVLHALVFDSPASRVAMRVPQLRLGTFFVLPGTPETMFFYLHFF